MEDQRREKDNPFQPNACRGLCRRLAIRFMNR